jgi:hypothetical protein
MYAFDVARWGYGAFAGAGVGVNEIPGTEIGCQQTARCRCEAKTWPYRPESQQSAAAGEQWMSIPR